MNVFIHADLDARIRRIARIYNLTDAKAKDMIIKTDKKRASYYNYTNKNGQTLKAMNCVSQVQNLELKDSKSNRAVCNAERADSKR